MHTFHYIATSDDYNSFLELTKCFQNISQSVMHNTESMRHQIFDESRFPMLYIPASCEVRNTAAFTAPAANTSFDCA